MENNTCHTVSPAEIEQRLRESLASSYRREVTRINVHHFIVVAALLLVEVAVLKATIVPPPSFNRCSQEQKEFTLQSINQLK